MKTKSFSQSLKVKATPTQKGFDGPSFKYTLPMETLDDAERFLLINASSYKVRQAEVARYQLHVAKVEAERVKLPEADRAAFKGAEFVPLTVDQMVELAKSIVHKERTSKKLTAAEKAARKANAALNKLIEQAAKLKAGGKDEAYVTEFLKLMDADDALVEEVLDEVFGEEENDG